MAICRVMTPSVLVVAVVPDAAVVVGRVVVVAAERILQDDPQTNTSAIRRYLPIMIGRS